MTGYLNDPAGQPSAMRLLTAVVVLALLGTWSVTVIRAGQWIPLDSGTVALILGCLGIKAWQRRSERIITPPSGVALKE